MNRTIFTIFLAACGLCSAVQAQRIKGSDTVLPLTQELSERFLKEHPSSEIVVTGGGSGVGLAALPENTTDIAMASRRIKFGEKMKFAKIGLEVKEVVVAYDALAVVVNPSNPVDRLTREQLEAIFRGKITNWKEVGGPDRRIVVYSRETSSGTYEFFKESVLSNKNYMSSILSMPATGAIIQSVRQTRGAIGYIGLAYLNPYVKALAVSYDGGRNYALPSVENAFDGSYPVVRPLYYYYDAAKEEQVAPFVSYILSQEGQRLVREEGFVPVRGENDAPVRSKE
ncbi:PstS family phosphate ABC transporter substrate-binding protein [Gallalistipes aquisgranensis]|uniref:PstS family phosphate ABC transporter substrate-binding protein n=1 Tax=Gallalistipes aquisgranensis TaxID=2779358 RepID=UPI001CF88893|nr:PstS family phosphate ABC transporter substrate-binding protein [Gallalistipes aquisgranensis]MBE5034226.1 PstS family phosphate ABC transporter substrate-binding protein [Gallalistipes aquisgranensis]